MSILKRVRPIIERIDLRIRKVQSTSDMFPLVHHIVCTVVSEKGIEYIGKGLALTEEHAFEKAIGEAIERYCVLYDGSFANTNGIALHTELESARSNAVNELLERDAYLCHFHTTTPFFAYSDVDRDGSIFPSVDRILIDHGFKLRVARLSSKDGLYITIAMCMGIGLNTHFGFTLGLGCSQSIKNSLNSSILEAISFLPSYIAGEELKMLTLEEYLSLSPIKVSDMASLAANPVYQSEVLPLFDREVAFVPSNFSPNIEFVEVRIPESLKICNFSVIKANSKDCQELFFTKDISERLNFERLKEFKGTEDIEYNLKPHFFA